MSQNMEKALQDLSKVINNEAVESIVIKITLRKQKTSKAQESKKRE